VVVRWFKNARLKNRSIDKVTKAFTLIELLMVVAIIGILTAVRVAPFNDFSNGPLAQITAEVFIL